MIPKVLRRRRRVRRARSRGILADVAARDLIPGLGARLKAARVAAGLTQQAVQEACGVVRTNLVRYERDTKTPTLRVLYVLARAYGVEVCSLLPPAAEVLGPAPAPPTE